MVTDTPAQKAWWRGDRSLPATLALCLGLGFYFLGEVMPTVGEFLGNQFSATSKQPELRAWPSDLGLVFALIGFYTLVSVVFWLLYRLFNWKIMLVAAFLFGLVFEFLLARPQESGGPNVVANPWGAVLFFAIVYPVFFTVPYAAFQGLRHLWGNRASWWLITILVLGISGGTWWSYAKYQDYVRLHPSLFSHTHSTSTDTAQQSAQLSSTNNNHWTNIVDPALIPLGDGHVSTAPQIGYVDSCTTNFRSGGARHAGSWINSTNATWDAHTKTAVEGVVHWPAAGYSETDSSGTRLLTTNDLPEIYPTGSFPISRSDPAYQYDTNPNHIGAQSLSYSLPLNPTTASSPQCLPLGPIGLLNDGVVFFNALDDAGRDAVAHETQDVCDGHPNGQEMYHYHNVPSCLRDKATAPSTLVGYAFDGYGIYVERDSKGNLPTNADLDACHGRTSPVMWNGALVEMYHYDATLEYPYTVGCFHGTPIVSRAKQP